MREISTQEISKITAFYCLRSFDTEPNDSVIEKLFQQISCTVAIVQLYFAKHPSRFNFRIVGQVKVDRETMLLVGVDERKAVVERRSITHNDNAILFFNNIFSLAEKRYPFESKGSLLDFNGVLSNEVLESHVLSESESSFISEMKRYEDDCLKNFPNQES